MTDKVDEVFMTDEVIIKNVRNSVYKNKPITYLTMA